MKKDMKMKTENNDFVVLDAGVANGEPSELTELELNLILGGYEPGYDENPDNDGGGRPPGDVYGPPPPPGDPGLPSSDGGYPPGMGGFPAGAPGMIQPGGGEVLAENLSDAAGYYGGHTAAEALDIASAASPFPFNYILDKASDAVRPTEGSYEEYAKNH